MRLSIATLSHQMIDLLYRLDVATFLLMMVACFYVLREAVEAKLQGRCSRATQLMVAFVACCGWIAMESFLLGMNRAVVLGGFDASWFINANFRLIVPMSGVAIGAGLVWWVTQGRPAIWLSVFGVAILLAAWPAPANWLMLTIYHLIDSWR